MMSSSVKGGGKSSKDGGALSWLVDCCDTVSGNDDDVEREPKRAKIACSLWQLDPSESFSDWKLIVKNSTSSSSIYHVHKSYLACGDRKCEYFVGQFRFAAKNDERRSLPQTEIDDMVPEAVSAFPAFLDFVYTGKKDFDQQDPATLVALHHLGHYFGCKALERHAATVIEQKCRPESVGDYIGSILNFQQESLLRLAYLRLLQKCLQSSSDAAEAMEIVHLLDADKFELFISSWAAVIRAQSQWLTNTDDVDIGHAVASYVRMHKERISCEQFVSWTGKEVFDLTSPWAALRLLELVDHYAQQEESSFCRRDDITCLQKRCVASLCDNPLEDSECDEVRSICNNLLTKDCVAPLLLSHAIVFSSKRTATDDDGNDDHCNQKRSNQAKLQIRVFGCVEKEANGVYEERGEAAAASKPRFFCNGSNHRISFVAEKDGTPEKWVLSAPGKGHLYEAEADTCKELPPTVCWSLVRRDDDERFLPGPVLIYEDGSN